MRLIDFLRSQIVDMIDRVEARGVLAYRNPSAGDRIENGARPTAGEGIPV